MTDAQGVVRGVSDRTVLALGQNTLAVHPTERTAGSQTADTSSRTFIYYYLRVSARSISR